MNSWSQHDGVDRRLRVVTIAFTGLAVMFFILLFVTAESGGTRVMFAGSAAVATSTFLWGILGRSKVSPVVKGLMVVVDFVATAVAAYLISGLIAS